MAFGIQHNREGQGERLRLKIGLKQSWQSGQVVDSRCLSIGQARGGRRKS